MEQLPKQIVEQNIPYDPNDSEAFLYKFTNLLNKKIYIGMGAGSISNWMKNLKKIFFNGN